MRRILGFILAGLAGFLLTTALVVALYAPSRAYVTPLNVDSTTHLTGFAEALPSGGSSPIKAVNRTVVDSAASDSSVAVWDTFTCVMKGTTGPDCVDDKDPQKRLIDASTDRFATARVSAESVNDGKYTEQTGVAREGLMNKFPFNVEQRTYLFWDSVTKRAVEARFVGEDDIDGLPVYQFQIDIPQTRAEISDGIKGTYEQHKTIWADPLTGSPIRQKESQVRKLENGQPVFVMDLAFTDDQVTQNVVDAKSNHARLALIGKAPWYALVLGLIAALGAFLTLRGTGRRPATDELSDPTLLDELDSDLPESRRRDGGAAR